MKRWIAVTGVLAMLVGIRMAAETPQVNPEAKLHKFSTVIEKERPELDETTRALIAEYRRNPTEANRLALRRQVEARYDAVVARKQAKLEELKATAKDAAKVEEMRVIVAEMLRDREKRIDQTMKRFADPRLLPNARQPQNGFLPVIGAAQDLSIAYTPVTNGEYAAFLKATKRKAPRDWQQECVCPAGKEDHPVVNVTYADALAYCQWLTAQATDGAVYRLPTAQEWEIAAGHMPKDADFNCGENAGTTPVGQYANTLAACGAIDMWGNVWEWTSTAISAQTGVDTDKEAYAVKGGAWNAPRTNCRTENQSEGRLPEYPYDNVGFRIARVK